MFWQSAKTSRILPVKSHGFAWVGLTKWSPFGSDFYLPLFSCEFIGFGTDWPDLAWGSALAFAFAFAFGSAWIFAGVAARSLFLPVEDGAVFALLAGAFLPMNADTRMPILAILSRSAVTSRLSVASWGTFCFQEGEIPLVGRAPAVGLRVRLFRLPLPFPLSSPLPFPLAWAAATTRGFTAS